MATIALDVLTNLDGRSAAHATRQIVDMFTSAADESMRAFDERFSKMGSAKSAFEELHNAHAQLTISSERLSVAQLRLNELQNNGHASMVRLAQAHLQVTQAQVGHEAATSRLNEAHTALASSANASSISMGALTSVAGGFVAGFVAAAAVVGGLAVELIKVGEAFEEIDRAITVHTSAIGNNFEALQNQALHLVGTLDTSTKNLGTDLAVLSGRLSGSSDEIGKLTEHVEMLRDRWGSLDIQALAGAFTEYKLSAAQADAELALLNQTARDYQVMLPQLIDQTATWSTVSQDLGLSIGQETVLLADLQSKHIDTAKAMGGLEVAEKALTKSNKDRRAAGQAEEVLPEYIARMTQWMQYYHDHNEQAKADEIALNVFGQRRWSEAKRAAEEYLRIVSQGEPVHPPPGSLDQFKEDTKSLGNLWQEITNKVQTAFAPAASSALEHVEVELRALYEDAQKLGPELGKIHDIFDRIGRVLGSIPNAIHGAVQRMGEMVPALQPIISAVEKLEQALQRVGALLHWNITVPGTAVMDPNAPGAPGFPKKSELQAGTKHLPVSPFYPSGPPPGEPPSWDDSKGHKGPRLPQAPELPYPAEYGQPPYPGESAENYRQRMELIEKQHKLAEDQARVTQLEKSNGATQEDIQKAKNQVLKDEAELNQAQLNAQQQHIKKLRSAANEFGELGAKLDADFGLSKGLPGLAENLTKFIANLAAAPMMGALGAIGQANAPGGLGGAAGLVGMGAASGAFGAAFMPGPGGYGAGGGGGGFMSMLFGERGGGGGGGGGGAYGGAAAYGGMPSPASVAAIARAQSMVGLPYAPGTSDCSGYVSQVYSAMTGSQIHFTTDSFNGPALGFSPLPAGAPIPPGALVIGVNPLPGQSGHMAATLPNGVSIESGGRLGGGPKYGGGAAGGMDPQFPQHWIYMPQSYAEGGEIGGTPGPTGKGGSGDPQLPDWWRKVLSSSIGGLGPSIPIDNAWMPNAGGIPPGDWFNQPSHLRGKGGIGGYDSGGDIQDMSPEMRDAWYWHAIHDNAHTISPWGVDPMQLPYGHPRSGASSGGAIPIMAHTGEHMLTAHDVEAMGGQEAVYAFRAGLHRFDVGGDTGDTIEEREARIRAGIVPQYPGVGGPPTGPTQIGGNTPNPGYGPGVGMGSGNSGLIGLGSGGGMAAPGGGMAAGAGAGAASMGIGIAAQMAMQEMQRAIQYGGAVAGIGVEGLMQTFLPTGASDLAANNWLTRIAGGIAGARPALPNVAGKAPGGPPPEAAMGGAQMPPWGMPAPASNPNAGGKQVGVHIENYNVTSSEDRAGADIARHNIHQNMPTLGAR